jgi:group I intron endonuclease
MYVYKITNKVNGKVYIGQTSFTPEKRFRQHCHKSNSSVSYIDAAIQKYGKENFEIGLLDTAETVNELNEKEMFWIAYYDSIHPKGYNLTKGGSGMLASDITKEKMRIAKLGRPSGRKGKPLSEAHKEALRLNHADLSGDKNPNYGKPLPEEQRIKISRSLKGRFIGDKNPSYGRKKTPEEIGRWQKSRMGYRPSEETKRKQSESLKGKNNKPVLCIEKKEVYNSVTEAAKSVGVSKSGITACCKGYQKTSGGYHWKHCTEAIK